jgi:hypothetical protein
MILAYVSHSYNQTRRSTSAKASGFSFATQAADVHDDCESAATLNIVG